MSDDQERLRQWQFKRMVGLLEEQNLQLKRIADRLERRETRQSFSVWDAAVTIVFAIYLYTVFT